MSIFLYSKSKHIRTETPPVFRNYRKFKSYLRKEFNRRCVYCLSHDVKDHYSYCVEHYRPKRKFPHLELEYMNLYYSCPRCNTLKRDYWPTVTQKKKEMIVPNPCEYVMFKHLRYENATVKAQSKSGEWTVDLLDLNERDKVSYREILIAAYESYQQEKNKQVKILKDLQNKIKSTNKQEQKICLTDAIEGIKGNIKSLDDNMELM